jgi:hypothetical protein
MRLLVHGLSAPSHLGVTSRVVDDETDDETDNDEGSGASQKHPSIDISRLFTAKVTAPSDLVGPGRGRFHGPFRTQQHRCRQIGWL